MKLTMFYSLTSTKIKSPDLAINIIPLDWYKFAPVIKCDWEILDLNNNAPSDTSTTNRIPYFVTINNNPNSFWKVKNIGKSDPCSSG